MIDTHIFKPTDDLFGFGDFGGALGRAIAETKNPDGTVIGLSGAWGSGKTSLIETYVVPALETAGVKIVRFDPWAAIEGRDLLFEFLTSLQGALPEKIRNRVASTLAAIARRAVPYVRDVTSVVIQEATQNLGFIGRVANRLGLKSIADTSDWASRLLGDQTLSSKLNGLRSELNGIDRRIVFIVDDLDRLPPDDLLLVFRMLRTVGRLPNVVYLLAIDRNVAERVVAERFPAEGASYLDKIVQTWFEVPTPHAKALERAVLDRLCRVAELNQREAQGLEKDAVFGRAVLPLLETPRDLKRLLGALELVWPALKGDVHIGDLAALEAMKLRHIETYRAIRRYEAWVSDPMSLRSLGEPPKEEEIARVFRVPGEDQPEARKRVLSALAALFPREIGQSVDGPDVAASVSDHQDYRDRRLTSLEHFHAYFRLAGSADTLRAGERTDLIQAFGDPARLRDILLRAAKTPSPTGGTRAPAYMYEIMVSVDQVDAGTAPHFVRGLFSVADDIDVAADNHVSVARLEHTVIGLLRHHGAESVAQWVEAALPNSGPRWALEIADRYHEDHDPRATIEAGPMEPPLVPEDRLAGITAAALTRFEQGVADGSVLRTPRRLAASLYAWTRLKRDDGKAARALTDHLLGSDQGVVTLAEAFTGEVLGGDTSGSTWRRPKLHRSRDVDLLDWDKLHSRVKALIPSPSLTAAQKATLERCKQAFDRYGQGTDMVRERINRRANGCQSAPPRPTPRPRSLRVAHCRVQRAPRASGTKTRGGQGAVAPCPRTPHPKNHRWRRPTACVIPPPLPPHSMAALSRAPRRLRSPCAVMRA